MALVLFQNSRIAAAVAAVPDELVHPSAAEVENSLFMFRHGVTSPFRDRQLSRCADPAHHLFPALYKACQQSSIRVHVLRARTLEPSLGKYSEALLFSQRVAQPRNRMARPAELVRC
jgi:hypothetical protein